MLAKGMHDTKSEVEKAFEFGADHVLVTGDGWDLYDDLGSIWAEPHTIGQLHVLRDSITGVWNSRNLDDGSEKQISFDTAREEHSGALIQASMIETVEDVHPEADGVLVGQHKRKFERTIQEHGILPDEGEGSDE